MADAKQFMVKLQGRDYMQVPGRVIMFRDTHPHGAISTDIVAVGEFLLAKAFVHDGDGRLMATGHATVRSGQGQKWSGREIEKAETAAIGRALGLAGFGTADADDDDGYLSDAPQARSKPTPPAPQPAPTGNGNGASGAPDSDVWDKAAQVAWWVEASKVPGMNKATALAILGDVKALADWTGGKEAAYVALDKFKQSEVVF